MSGLTPSKRSSLACHEQDAESVQSDQSSAALDTGINQLNLREESVGKRTRPIDAATLAGLRQSLAAGPAPTSPPLPPDSVCGFVAAGPSSHALSSFSYASHLPLPMSTAPSASTPAPAPVSEPQTVSSPKQDLLLVEDVRVSQRIARVALARARFRVEVAENGEEAVEMYRKGKFDIILMDIQLPKMNGIEATIKIREIEQKEGRPAVIIFGLTGSLSESDLASYKAAGMQGCIGKGSVLESAVPEALEEYEKKPHEFTLIKLGGLMSPAVGGRQIGLGANPSHAPAASSLASSARASVPSTRAMGSSRSLHIGHQASAPLHSPQGPVSSHAVSHSAQPVAPITTAAPPQNSASSTGLTDPSNTK